MNKTKRGLVCWLLSAALGAFLPGQLMAVDNFAGQSITVAGTGDSQSLLRVLAAAFEKTFPGSQVIVPNSIGSSGGVKALAEGKIELARVARPLKAREQQADIHYHLFANNPVVFVINASIEGLDNIKYRQIVDVYSGKITRWEQLGAVRGKIYALMREPGDSSLSVLQKQLPGFKDMGAMVAKTFYSTPETVNALVKHKNTIGFIPITEAKKFHLRILKINAFYPSAENVQAGNYKLITPFAIVSKGELTGLAKVFVDFLYSDQGRAIIAEFGALPNF